MPSIDELAADARAALGGEGELVGGEPQPRYELFHAPNSICSQKVRTVLAQLGIPYVARSVSIFLGQTYLPGYVRLRMAGCGRLGAGLMTSHSGSTAVSAGGCDAAVVPTLVDWEAAEVLVDSKRICLHLDEAGPNSRRLRPAASADAIDAELAIVDNLPNYQLLMGRKPGAGEASETRSGTGASLSLKKVAWCDRYLADHADDAVLVEAYSAKRAKELSAAETLFTAAAMQAAHGRAEAACVALDRKLARRGGGWLMGERVSLADLFWGVELLRMKNVGASRMWEDGRLPHVARFVDDATALPSIQSAVLAWPRSMY